MSHWKGRTKANVIRTSIREGNFAQIGKKMNQHPFDRKLQAERKKIVGSFFGVAPSLEQAYANSCNLLIGAHYFYTRCVLEPSYRLYHRENRTLPYL